MMKNIVFVNSYALIAIVFNPWLAVSWINDRVWSGNENIRGRYLAKPWSTVATHLVRNTKPDIKFEFISCRG